MKELIKNVADMHLLNEPYIIKTVENICFKSFEERLKALQAVHFNPFRICHQDVIVDLLSDSGMNSISTNQQSKSLIGDESYAGAKSFKNLEKNVRTLTGFDNILPFHQKRLCEEIICEVLAKPGGLVVANTFTHTMDANLKDVNSIPVSLVTTDNSGIFGGNMDMEKLRSFVSEKGSESIDFVVINAPSKILGGLPVSLANIEAVTTFCRRHSILVFLETSMYAENSWFIKNFETGQSKYKLISIAQNMFSYFDGCILSFARDGMNLTGSVFACRDKSLMTKLQPSLILKGGFVSYGGMTGRLMETIAVGMLEAFNEIYLDFRFKQMSMIEELLKQNGVPIIKPIGTNTIFIDVDEIQKRISIPSYPAWSMNCAAYIFGGIRAAEYGQLTGPGSSLPDNHPLAKKELIKFEIPRRTYTTSHYLYVARVLGQLIAKDQLISGMRLLESKTGRLRHLKLKLEPLNPEKLKSSNMTNLQTLG